MTKIEIIVNNDGSVTVNGFPGNLMSAMRIIDAGKNVVVGHFVKCATEGRLDESGNIHEKLIKEAVPAPLILPH